MRILFAISHLGFLRNFESTLALLAERGHQIHLVTDRNPTTDTNNDGRPILDRLAASFPGAFSWETVRISKEHPWYAFAAGVRDSLNYWRYLSPAFNDAPKLRARGRKHAPAPSAWLTALPLMRSRPALRLLTTVFRTVESLIPVRRDIEALFERWAPDVLFITPLLYFGSTQVDYVRCARQRGIASVLGVGSWDHLTTKGLIHELPDRIVVWNELQAEEARDLHGAKHEQVVVTGAQPYDHWFATRPSTSREAFCRRVGLSTDRPYFLYLCSSPFIAPYEVDVVRRWLTALREHGSERLRTAGVLVRPHPQNAAQWAGVELGGFGDVVIWPRTGANPIGLDARGEYYDSMHHSHAVVGVNTSALIESGIVGRPVFSFRVPEFSGTQEGTLHFRHLKRHGLLTLADTLDEHAAQLDRSFESVDRDRERIQRFIQIFVRPNGLDDAATPRVVCAIEEVAGVPHRAAAPPPHVRAVQIGLHGVLVCVTALGRAPRLAAADERAKLLRRVRRALARGRAVLTRAPRMVRRRAHSTRKLARRVFRRA